MRRHTSWSKLSKTFVERITEPGRYGDGRGSFGLSLLVKVRSNGRLSKSWSQRLRLPGGRYTSKGLGAWPLVTLAEARRKCIENQRSLNLGNNPFASSAPLFKDAVDKVIEMQRSAWKGSGSEDQWRSCFARYVFPLVGELRIPEITSAHVLEILKPIWTSKNETARRVLSRVSIVMRWSIAQGYRLDNPAGEVLLSVLPKINGNGKTHLKALPHSEVGMAVERVAASDAWIFAKLAFRFLVLTAARSGEVRGATWSEIDLEGKAWDIPAPRMKAGRAHSVPLSNAAVAILHEAKRLQHGSDLVFPSRKVGKIMTDYAISKLVKDAGIDAVPHGFRSSFRDWCAENAIRREVAEAALAHTVKGVEGAYFRSDLFEARREAMEKWSSYLHRGRV